MKDIVKKAVLAMRTPPFSYLTCAQPSSYKKKLSFSQKSGY
jgi:hypothetical protein